MDINNIKTREEWNQFWSDVYEFMEVCEYNNRTYQENLELLIRDNPYPEDIEYYTLVMEQAQILRDRTIFKVN